MKKKLNWIKNGGVTSAMGFCAAGIAAGIKSKSKKDMALVVSDCEATVGATYTTNAIKAAPVKVSMKHSRRKRVRAVVFNSGNANACTGVRGITDAMMMAEETGRKLGVKPTEVLVCSTGRIGERLPKDRVKRGIAKLAKKISHTSGRAAAKSIMTSDSHEKECAVQFQLEGINVVLGGMAKGAGMIHPNMATMLCCITTDAAVEKKTLQACTAQAVEKSFNRISVDGDMSTNDTVIVLSNGLARNTPITMEHPEKAAFQNALTMVMRRFARMIVEDGEGISRVIDLVVQGAASYRDAKLITQGIARSPLVKTSWAGGDPNWGRLMSSIGASGARVREELVDIYYDGIIATKGGVASSTPKALLKREARKKQLKLTIDLHLGKARHELWVTDLTEEYVAYNKSE